VLGAVELSLNVDLIGQHIASTTNLMVRWAVVIVVIVIASLLLLLQPLVIGPIAALSRAAAAAAAGREAGAVRVALGDEIGQLADAFNTMMRNLKDALERNESIVRGIADPMVVIDQDGAVTFMNEPCERLTEHSREAVVGAMGCRELMNCAECQGACGLAGQDRPGQGTEGHDPHRGGRRCRHWPRLADPRRRRQVREAIGIFDVSVQRRAEPGQRTRPPGPSQ
jgi:HAMP domain-containing protein